MVCPIPSGSRANWFRWRDRIPVNLDGLLGIKMGGGKLPTERRAAQKREKNHASYHDWMQNAQDRC
jgi:hypothetical protein